MTGVLEKRAARREPVVEFGRAVSVVVKYGRVEGRGMESDVAGREEMKVGKM